MRKFTVRDFIALQSPCFSCSDGVVVRIGTDNYPTTLTPAVYLKPLVLKGWISIDLQITYNSTLTLSIEHKTNKFETNNLQALTKYLEGHKLFLHCYCSSCNTDVTSFFLDFNLERKFIKPVGICHENIVLLDKSNMYQISSAYGENQSLVTIDRINKATPISPVYFQAPLLPRQRFKNKQQLINKIKIYLPFA